MTPSAQTTAVVLSPRRYEGIRRKALAPRSRCTQDGRISPDVGRSDRVMPGSSRTRLDRDLGQSAARPIWCPAREVLCLDALGRAGG